MRMGWEEEEEEEKEDGNKSADLTGKSLRRWPTGLLRSDSSSAGLSLVNAPEIAGPSST